MMDQPHRAIATGRHEAPQAHHEVHFIVSVFLGGVGLHERVNYQNVDLFGDNLGHQGLHHRRGDERIAYALRNDEGLIAPRIDEQLAVDVGVLDLMAHERALDAPHHFLKRVFKVVDPYPGPRLVDKMFGAWGRGVGVKNGPARDDREGHGDGKSRFPSSPWAAED